METHVEEHVVGRREHDIGTQIVDVHVRLECCRDGNWDAA